MSLDWSSVKALSIPVGGTARDVKRVSVGGTVLWEKAPAVPYDAEVEYLESTGTQYIDTGIIGNTSLDTVVAADFAAPTSAIQFVFGCRDGSNGRFGFAVIYDQYSFGYRDDHALGQRTGARQSCLFTATTGERSCTVDGSTVTATDNVLDTDLSMFLFSRNYNGATGQFFTGRIYSCRITQNGTLVRDYIPVRVGTTGFLYDRANPTGGPSGNGLYGNSGSGAFVVGPDKSS